MFKKYVSEYKIEGMHCMHCAKRVEESLKNIKGVKKVMVSLEEKKVTLVSRVELDHAIVKEAIENLGYSLI